MSTARINDTDAEHGPRDEGSQPDAATHSDDGVRGDRDSGEVLQRQRRQYGGVKLGSAFFGWVAATGVAVLLTALVAAAGTAVTVASTNNDAAAAASQAISNAATVGVGGAVVLFAVVFVAYLCGGYVAGRMARFNGLKQGLAVWLWAVLVAVVVAVLAAVAGSKYDVLGTLNSFPRIPVSADNLTRAGIVALVVVGVASLAGALLGGLMGMRFHRHVDAVGLAR
jgi:hypothetical protein